VNASTPISSPARIAQGVSLTTDTGNRVLIRAWRGEGSYARVYQAVYSRTGGLCALKMAKPEIHEGVQRLSSEREALLAVHDPHVVALLDWGRHGDVPYLVLEWLEGETVYDLVGSRRRLPLRQSLEILEGVCAGLAAIHLQGMAHGDIRAQNVLLVDGRGAVLTDPGVSAGADLHPGQTEDIRSVGALLHRMLAGEDPSPGRVRLTAGTAYSRAVVDLWERTQASRPPAASELVTEVRRLRLTL
jgi:serine/threonine protein kinase